MNLFPNFYKITELQIKFGIKLFLKTSLLARDKDKMHCYLYICNLKIIRCINSHKIKVCQTTESLITFQRVEVTLLSVHPLIYNNLILKINL